MDQTHLACIGRQILGHWTTKEVLFHTIFNLSKYSLQWINKDYFLCFIGKKAETQTETQAC